jgi:6-pyruvoyltetrahydropterin/6-carboxytetrahydropterin synthase
MSYEVGIVAQFTASHHLVGDFGPAKLPHTHDYRAELSVSGDTLLADGTLFDITRLQQAVAEVVAELNGANLNAIAGLGLAGTNPTAEVVARFFFDRVAPAVLGQGLAQLRARVWESPEAYAGYSGDLT